MSKIILFVLFVLVIPVFCLGSSFSVSQTKGSVALAAKKKEKRIAVSSKNKKKRIDLLRRYCESHLVNQYDYTGVTRLFRVKFPYEVDFLARAKANINHQNFNGETALSRALSKPQSARLIYSLLKFRADPLVENNSGKSVLSRLFYNEASGFLSFDGKYLGAVKTSRGKETKLGLLFKAIQYAAV
jgi:hypothetical protein